MTDDWVWGREYCYYKPWGAYATREQAEEFISTHGLSDDEEEEREEFLVT